MPGRTDHLTKAALMTALMCIAGPLTLPLGPVPVSLTSAAVMLAGMLLGPKAALGSCGAYLLLGCAGLPVFSGFTGGAGQLLGPTGGFLVGYLPLAAVSGAAGRIRRTGLQALLLAAGTAALYALGTAWFCLQSGSGFVEAATVCALPFLPADAAKIALVITIARRK